MDKEQVEILERVLTKKKKPIVDKVNTGQLALIVGLTNPSSSSEDGWMTMDEILKERGADGKLLFKPQRATFSNYIKSLESLGLVERRLHSYRDKRKRKHETLQFRLRRDNRASYNVYGLIASSWSWNMEEGMKMTLPIDIKAVLGRGYFKNSGQGYRELLDEQIKQHQGKIELFKKIKEASSKK